MALQKLTTGTQLGAGAIVQYVHNRDSSDTSSSVAIPFDNSIPQNIEGVELMTLSITPKASTNLLVVKGIAHLQAPSADSILCLALFKDSVADAVDVSWKFSRQGNTSEASVPIMHTTVAGGVSPITFKLRFGSASLTAVSNWDGNSSRYGGALGTQIEIWEIAA